MSRRAKRRFIWWTVSVLVLGLLVGGGFVALHLLNQQRDPAAQVEQYLGYLADGKAEAASAMVSPGASKGDAALLTDEVLKSATERIEVRSVETVSRDGDGAEVRAKMSLGGEKFERTFHVEHGPKEFLVLDTWKLDEPFVAKVDLRVDLYETSVEPVTVEVGGAAIEARVLPDGEPPYEAMAMLYPGVYEMTARAGEYLDPVSADIVAGLEDQAPQELGELKPNAELMEAVLAQAQDYADGCVSIGGNGVIDSNMDPACPTLTQNKQLDSLKVLDRPTGMSQFGLRSFTTEPFEFEVKGNTKGARSITETWVLRGEIDWKDGKAQVVDAVFERY